MKKVQLQTRDYNMKTSIATFFTASSIHFLWFVNANVLDWHFESLCFIILLMEFDAGWSQLAKGITLVHLSVFSLPGCHYVRGWHGSKWNRKITQSITKSGTHSQHLACQWGSSEADFTQCVGLGKKDTLSFDNVHPSPTLHTHTHTYHCQSFSVFSEMLWWSYEMRLTDVTSHTGNKRVRTHTHYCIWFYMQTRAKSYILKTMRIQHLPLFLPTFWF